MLHWVLLVWVLLEVLTARASFELLLLIGSQVRQVEVLLLLICLRGRRVIVGVGVVVFVDFERGRTRQVERLETRSLAPKSTHHFWELSWCESLQKRLVALVDV